MDIQKLALFAMVAAIFALFLRSLKSEWGHLFSIAAALVIALYMLSMLKETFTFFQEVGKYVKQSSSYMKILLKAVGVTYLCEFASDLSRDTGNHLIAGQIELCGKIAILLLGIPILMTLLEVIGGYL